MTQDVTGMESAGERVRGALVHGAAGSVRPQARAWGRYVAIGDSFTEGMSDPDPVEPDAYVGWADRLSRHLSAAHPGLLYANLARAA